MSPDIKRLRIRTEVIKRYYVVEGNDWHSIYGGPFDTEDEARECLQKAQFSDIRSRINPFKKP